MRKILRSKWVRVPYRITLYSFALYGAFLTLTYLAMKFKWTNDAGMVDANNRYFQEMHDKYNQNFKVDSVSMQKHRYEVLNRIIVLNEFYPVNAQYVLSAYQKTQDERLALQMLDAVDLRLQKDRKYQRALQKMKEKSNDSNSEKTGLSVFEWMNIEEWKYFKEAVAKDKKWIDSAARVTGVEGRFIVACLVGEQVRLFNSRREKFKDLVAPLKTLALETNLSYGVTGIKENTAIRIEQYLKDSTSVYYLGKEYAHLLDYDSMANYTNNLNDTMSVRLQRLVQFNNHYYSYLYAAIFIKQIKMQWERAGYPIDDRPEILASLFNLGYAKSKPKKNPGVGGSVFKVRETEYTFGSVAYEFYYSGEMADLFPYEKKHFDWMKKKE
jgi:coenzyme F420-reducing hydrogenase delta subunit